jgi:AraC-like DNA-binding protein
VPEATIATSLLIDFLGFLGRRGLAAEAVCSAARIDPRWLDQPNARVPASAMERLWAAGEQLTGDADLGLHSAESYNPGALSIVGYVILSCRTAGDALTRLARYAPLLNEGLRVSVDHEQGATFCRFGAAEGVDSFLHRSPRQAIETLAAGIVLTLKRLATQPPEPAAVTFRHAAPPSTAEHHRLFGAVVRFGQPENAVVYPSSALAAGMLSADPALLEVFEGDARRRLEQLKSHGAVSGRVQTILGSRLNGEVPSLASIASELAMSERSVQRSLSEERTTYREIVDDVRKGLALAHLSRPSATATDVALLLGFSEPSAFTRAFRRWTGVSPTQFRCI